MRKWPVILTSAILLLGISELSAQADMIAGEVRKIDESAQKITIKHGPIKKFDMDEGMTMVFRASDPSLLKTVKPGDRIKFEADRINGQFTVIKIEKVP